MSKETDFFLEIPFKESPSVVIPLIRGSTNMFQLKTRDSYLELLEVLENWVKNNQRTTEKQYSELLDYKLGYSVNDRTSVLQSFTAKEKTSRGLTQDFNKSEMSQKNSSKPSNDISVCHTNMLISYLEESLLSTSKRPHRHKMETPSRNSPKNNLKLTSFETPMNDNLSKRTFLKTPDKPKVAVCDNLSNSKQNSPIRNCPSTIKRFKNAGTKPSTRPSNKTPENKSSRKQRVNYVNYHSPSPIKKELQLDYTMYNLNRLKSPIKIKRYNMYESFLFTGKF